MVYTTAKKNAQTKTDEFTKILSTCKRKPIKKETDRSKKIKIVFFNT